MRAFAIIKAHQGTQQSSQKESKSVLNSQKYSTQGREISVESVPVVAVKRIKSIQTIHNNIDTFSQSKHTGGNITYLKWTQHNGKPDLNIKKARKKIFCSQNSQQKVAIEQQQNIRADKYRQSLIKTYTILATCKQDQYYKAKQPISLPKNQGSLITVFQIRPCLPLFF